MGAPLILETPLKSATSALETFISLRKAEGASPATIANYRNVILPFLRDYPEFLSHLRAVSYTHLDVYKRQP